MTGCLLAAGAGTWVSARLAITLATATTAATNKITAIVMMVGSRDAPGQSIRRYEAAGAA